MKQIFLVEDDREIARNLSLLLRSEGFEVFHAPIRQAAVDMLGGNRFDLALVDISLPDGNGFSLCAEITGAQDISRPIPDGIRRRGQRGHWPEYGGG